MLHLVLSDDWELRGNGSGNMRAIQFDTIRRLTAIYERHGLRGTFNAEVMQQLAHLRFGERHPELLTLAREWEEVVREVYGRGHDVQLHIHPQWTAAEYTDGRWILKGDWSILKYPQRTMQAMIGECKTYLESLLRPLNPDYRCVSFRSGSWCLAPNAYILDALVGAGIVFDMSMTEGIVYDMAHVRLDYRQIDEPFLPFYPRMDDARRVSDRPEAIVCVPTHSFKRSFWHKLSVVVPRGVFSRIFRLPRSRFPSVLRNPNETPIPNANTSATYGQEFWASRDVPTREVSDLSTLSLVDMRWILADMRRRARASGWRVVPVMLENHTKDIGNFWPFERFAEDLTRARDVQVLTATELARNIQTGVYPVRFAAT